MNQEKTGKFIRELRKKNNLSQSQLADILGVTYQAVSKWENGKNLPDMATMKQISKTFDVNIEEIINGELKQKKKKKLLLIIPLLLVIIIIIIILNTKSENFEFNELSTTSHTFSISGSVAQLNNRTSLIINKVYYNETEDETTYKNLSCKLYEEKGNTKKEISSCENGKNKTLKEYLEKVKIKMDHYSESCKMFTSSKMYIEINAKDNNKKTITYKIPLKINKDDCQ